MKIGSLVRENALSSPAFTLQRRQGTLRNKRNYIFWYYIEKNPPYPFPELDVNLINADCLVFIVIRSLIKAISNDLFENTLHSKQKQLISLILGLVQGYL